MFLLSVSSWFLCPALQCILLVCIHKVGFLPPTPNETFLPVSTLPILPCLLLPAFARYNMYVCKENYCLKSVVAQLWGRKQRKIKVRGTHFCVIIMCWLLSILYLHWLTFFDLVLFAAGMKLLKRWQTIWIMWPSSSLLWNWQVPPFTSPYCLFVLSICVPVIARPHLDVSLLPQTPKLLLCIH